MTTKLHTVSRLSLLMLCLFANAYCLTSYADAIGYRCTMGDLVRRLEINYPQSPKTLPCHVVYYKDVEEPNQEKVLWRAQNDASYCETKADGMIDDLVQLGWQCGPQ